MENIVIDNKNKISNYQPTPNLFYDIEGVVTSNKGKDIKIEKTMDNKIVEYTLRLKEEIDVKTGESAKIEKEDILSMKIEEKKEIIEEDQGLENVSDILKELGLEYSEENIRVVEHLIKSGIPITKNNTDSYKQSREYLNKIIEDIDPNSFVKLIHRGIDLEGENLKDIAEALESIKNEKNPFSIKKFLKLDKELTYKEAEVISREIYGQKMGKDVYDTIIALDEENLPINRESIDKVTEVMRKLYNIKDIEDETYIKVINEDRAFNIDNLFKIKNDYTINTIDKSINAEIFELSTIVEDTNIDSLREMLLNLDIDDTMENISILREFIVNNMVMDKESYNRLISMKEDLNELKGLLNHNQVSKLIHREIDPMKEDIHQLVEVLKNEDIVEEPINQEEKNQIIKRLEDLGKVEDKDLLQLLKQGQDFNLKSIKEIINTNIEKEISIEYKTLDRTNYISNILDTLGERLNPEVVLLANEKYNTISLENLYLSHNQLEEVEGNTIPIESVEESLIFDEYLRARNSLTTNMIKESIKDGKTIEEMPLDEVNVYIEKKINRYKEIDRITKGIQNLRGNEEKILPIIMKNNLPMTLKEVKDINEFLNGQKGLSQTLGSITREDNIKYTDEFKASIKLLQEKISSSIKEGSENVKEDYRELISSMNNPKDSFDGNKDEESKEGKDYMEIQKKISKKDMIFQFPIDLENGYKDLNIIIPNIKKGIDKNNMSFSIGLETENLGRVNMDIRVIGKEVQINMEEEGQALEANIEVLEKSLEKLGYLANMKDRIKTI